MSERRRQSGFTESAEVVWDLQTGRRSLRTRRTKKPPEQVSRWDRARAMSSWWTRKCREPFLLATQSWPLGQAVAIAEMSGLNVEFSSGETTAGEAEMKLRNAIKEARGRPISALDIAMRFRNEARAIEKRLGSVQSSWVNSFLDRTVDLIAEELNLSQKMRSHIRASMNQPLLPIF